MESRNHSAENAHTDKEAYLNICTGAPLSGVVSNLLDDLQGWRKLHSLGVSSRDAVRNQESQCKAKRKVGMSGRETGLSHGCLLDSLDAKL